MSRLVSMMRVGPLGAELTESQAALRVFLAAGGLVLLGLVLLLLTIWWWRGTKPESPALGPLEVMSDRKWASAADGERRRLLEEHRPEGAAAAYEAPVPVDLSVLARDAPSSFDDLRDPVEIVVGDVIDPEAAELASTDHADALDRPVAASPLVPSHADVGGDSAVEEVVTSNGDHVAPAPHRPLAPLVPPAPPANGTDAGDDAPAGAVDATSAMSRDETTALPAPDPSLAPHHGA